MGTVLEQMAIVTARNAAIAIMAALLRQRLSGTGQHIDVSIIASDQHLPNFIHAYSLRVPLSAGALAIRQSWTA